MKTNRPQLLTRRESLRLGGLLAGGGFLASTFLTHRAHAQTGKVSQRVMFILSQNGVPGSAWSMSDGMGGLKLGGAFSPLERHRSALTVVEGLSYKHTAGHVGGSLTFLTNRPMSPNDQNNANTRAQGESLDHFLARSLREAGEVGSNALLTTSAGGDAWGGGQFITYEGPGRPIKASSKPDEVFTRVFGGAAPTSTSSGMPAPAVPAEWKARSRQSVLDFVQEEYRQLKSTLGPHESKKLDETMSSVREVESELIKRARLPEVPRSAACMPGQRPGSAVSTSNPDGFATMTKILLEAMGCGESLVTTIRFKHGMWSDGEVHGFSHEEKWGDPGTNFQKHTAWQAEQVALLLDRMQAKSLGAGSLLDHTLVFWCNEIGVSKENGYHGGNNLPVILAGGFGGRVSGGRLVGTTNLRHSALLVSIAQGMGHQIDAFGDMTGCTPGPVPGLLKG